MTPAKIDILQPKSQEFLSLENEAGIYEELGISEALIENRSSNSVRIDLSYIFL